MDEEIYCCSECTQTGEHDTVRKHFTRNHGIYVLGESIYPLKGTKAQAEKSNALEAEDHVQSTNVDEIDEITINVLRVLLLVTVVRLRL